MKRTALMLGTLLLVAASASTFAAEPRPYSEGPVTDVTYIKIKPGKFDEYMAWLDGQYKVLMEEYKKAGIITGYTVYATQAHNPQEPDLILTVTYKNMGAMDNLDERTESIDAKVVGSRQKGNQEFAARETMREVTGGRLLRELVLK